MLGQFSGQNQGIEIITSGGKEADSLFIKLVKERDLKVIFIPTAASSLRSESGVIWNPDSLKNKDDFKKELLRRFNLAEITILHTRNHKVANSKDFASPFEGVKAVWISGGNPGRFMAAYRGTRLIRELENIIKVEVLLRVNRLVLLFRVHIV